MSTLKSGLDPDSQFVLGETREEFALLQTEYYNRFNPTTPEERYQLDTVLRNEWFLRRFFRVEAQLWEHHAMKAERHTGVELGEAFTKANAIFMRLQRRITAAEKSRKEAMAELKRLQQPSQPQETKAETQQMASLLPFPLTEDMGDLQIAQLDRFVKETLAKAKPAEPLPPDSDPDVSA